MNSEVLRLLLTVALMFLLLKQAGRAMPGSRRRLAFGLGAGGIGTIAVMNALVAMQFGATWLYTLLGLAGFALLAGSVLALVFAYRGGELDEQFRQVRASTLAERERREQKERGE
ncbi:hypothetical protein [Candidatus Chloroploca asiatica]|uniref:Uncharacterized protein n=1 Tax=Candidatus Chloroploca asiatica TaxID=1506545 RepID=A0A2H3L2Q1_9CHLR|nr:hypothetical protein [Candidatus Chloroploca asiatica]PDV99033.1 hypothetical protein A9Q02_13815 [Candidatus Chloroploca asiatica]